MARFLSGAQASDSAPWHARRPAKSWPLGAFLLAAAALTLLVWAGCGKSNAPPKNVAPRPLEQAAAGETRSSPSPPPKLPAEWNLAETTVDALSRIGKPAVPALVKALDDPDRNLRRDAVRALSRMGSQAKAAVPALVPLLNDPDLEVRKNAARALGQIGPDAASAVPALIRELKSAEHEQPKEPEPSRHSDGRAG